MEWVKKLAFVLGMSALTGLIVAAIHKAFGLSTEACLSFVVLAVVLVTHQSQYELCKQVSRYMREQEVEEPFKENREEGSDDYGSDGRTTI